jgi:hypothetical protein
MSFRFVFKYYLQPFIVIAQTEMFKKIKCQICKILLLSLPKHKWERKKEIIRHLAPKPSYMLWYIAQMKHKKMIKDLHGLCTIPNFHKKGFILNILLCNQTPFTPSKWEYVKLRLKFHCNVYSSLVMVLIPYSIMHIFYVYIEVELLCKINK